MSMLPVNKEPDYSDGRTKQAFKDATDINKLLYRAWKSDTLSHLQKYQGEYADFSEFDMQEAQFALARAKTIFEELPAEVRKEFFQSPQAFFEFVNNPANKDKLVEKLPHLAKPGRQRVVPRAGGSPEPARAPQAPENRSPEGDPAPKDESPS